MLTRLKTGLDNVSLWKKGMAVVSIPLVVLIMTLFLVAWYEKESRNAQDRVSQSLEIKAALNQVFSLLVESETGVRGYLLWNRASYLEPYNHARSHIEPAVDNLTKLVQSNAAQTSGAQELKRQAKIKIATLSEMLQSPEEAASPNSPITIRSRDSMRVSRDIIEEMRETEERQLDLRDREHKAAAARIHNLFIILFLVALLCGITASYIVSASILKRVHDLERYAHSVSRSQEARWTDQGEDEIGQLGRNIELMTQHLLARKEALKAAQKQLEKANADLAAMLEETRASNQELESFSYSVSHDLRAPLRHVAGFSELMLRNPDSLDAKNRRYLGIISSSIQQMGVLIDELLSFSRMGRTAIKSDPVDLTQVVNDVITDLSPELENRHIDWKVGTLPVVRGDKTMIQLVFQNLVGNALKYSRSKDPAIIEIVSSRHETLPMEVITIKDNGVGFDMQYIDKLFGVFQRLHSAEDYEGTGIGLATVRRIVHRHGGQVTAKGKSGEGAEFTITLPADRENG